MWSYYGLQRLADNSAIFVAPQGLNNGWANSGGEDVTLVDDIIRQIEATLCVDTTQRFATGFSYGGAMSYSLACSRSTVFRAVAVQSAGVLSGCAGGTQPIAYLGIHGIRDGVLSISGGRGLRDRFVTANGCAPQSPREPGQSSLTHVGTDYTGCSAGRPVRWVAFDEGHIAAPQDGATGDSGTRTWVPGEVWRFFAQFQSTGTPSPSPSGSPGGSPSNPPPGGACTARYAVTNSWQGGFQADVTVTAGAAAITGWRVTWTYANGQTITQIWGGRNTPSGTLQNVVNETWNGSLAAGASTTFGFLATAGTANPVPAVTCARA
ncbi:cellulose binding domain-containing protein [Asanoa siamensis]|uniref:cellulose binding domain-containing protein n=1 Tax=Asanoa siamensis TaxID=926357 RepID=UPI0027E4A5B9|nr:cellulose binding domain-containing protein [Asanoa siamensis]